MGPDRQAPEGSVRRCLNVCASSSKHGIGKEKLFLVGKKSVGNDCWRGCGLHCSLALCFFVPALLRSYGIGGFAWGFVFSSTYIFSFHTLAHGPKLRLSFLCMCEILVSGVVCNKIAWTSWSIHRFWNERLQGDICCGKNSLRIQ